MNALDELNIRLGIGPARPRLPITLQRSGYTSVRQLGKGSFGSAYLVFHSERKQSYVVKHVNMATMTARQCKDARQEISLLQQLDHPNIVRYIECCEERPHLYIVMEYADGGDVFTHLKNLKSSTWALGGGGMGAGGSEITEAQVISLFVQTTMAVKYMHDRRLLHRDIKSQNVFLTQNHVVKLGDFGISTVLMSTVAMAQTMCGTPCYFSPELCKGKPYNNKSDVWALGVLLYELCTVGRLPFEATSMNRLMDSICNEEPRRIASKFSDELWNLICWMLKKDPRHRPDAGQILSSPVLMQAIPDIAKKLSATDSRHEMAYKKLFSHDSPPLPPIKPCVEPFARADGKDAMGKNSGGDVSAAAAAAAAGGGVRLDLFRRGIGEYPFNRAREAPARDWLAARQPQVQAQPQVQPQAAGGKEVLKAGAAPPMQSPIVDKLGYDPVLLRGKKKDPPRLKNTTNQQSNAHNENELKVPLGGYEKGESLSRGLKAPTDASAVIGLSSKPLKPLEHTPREKPLEQQPPRKQTPPGLHPKKETRKVNIGKVSLQELFMRYDETKKRLAREREEREGLNHPPDIVKHQPVPAKVCVAPPAPWRAAYDEPAQLLPPSMPQLLDASTGPPHQPPPPPQTQNREVLRSEEVSAPVDSLPQDDLTRVLEEMTNRFEKFHSLSIGHDDAVSSSFTPSIPVTPPDNLRPAEDAEEFADAMGTTLDMMGIQRGDGNEANARVPLTVASLSRAEQMGKIGESPLSLHASRNASLGSHAHRSSGAGANVKANGQSDAAEKRLVGSTERSRNSDVVDSDMTFVGGCLCEGVSFAGLASTIYGSFVCNCLACSKVSGTMSGVEWLHLPDISFQSLFTANETASGPQKEAVAGGGAVAAQALAGKASPTTKDKREEPALPPLLGRNAVRVPVVDDKGGSAVAVFVVYFCTQCGSTIGMSHSEIEGTIIAKGALSDESLEILETFQRTVAIEESTDGKKSTAYN